MTKFAYRKEAPALDKESCHMMREVLAPDIDRQRRNKKGPNNKPGLMRGDVRMQLL
jgi:hypothetical protein